MPSNLIKTTSSLAHEDDVVHSLSEIIAHLNKSLEVNFVRIPGIEEFKNSKEQGYGVRYVSHGAKEALRFNWQANGDVGKVDTLMSVDAWNGTSRDPTKNIKTKPGASFNDCLDHLTSALSKAHHHELEEAKKGEFTPEAAISDFFLRLRKGKTFTRGDFIQFYHNENVDVFDTLVHRFSNQIVMTGKRVSARRGTDWEKLKHDVLKAAQSTLNVDDGGTDEEYADWQEGSGGVSFSASLEHLEELTRGIAKGSYNALFVAGKGGTGKTQTVESALKGTPYEKVSGSATAAGIYSLLYKFHDSVILFDDADGALEDIDARNLIKAATDTKKVRRLSWQKSGNVTSKDGRIVPPTFSFEGRIIFISNLPLDKLDPDGSIRTRAYIIVINPSNAEMLEYMGKILPNIPVSNKITMRERQRVLGVVKEMGKTHEINLRTLVRALNLYASGVPNWDELVKHYA